MRIEPLLTLDSDRPRLPSSKSHANRALVLAALSGRPCTLTRVTPADDVCLMASGLQILGFSAQWNDAGDEIRFDGSGRQTGSSADRTIDCELAGTTLRFLSAVAATVPGQTTLTGNARMRERPIGALVDALRALGAEICCDTGSAPLTVAGQQHFASKVEIDPGTSSQFISALLLIAPVLPDGLEVVFGSGPRVSSSYIDLTIRCLRDCGVEVQQSTNSVRVPPTELVPPDSWPIEGDWSAAGFHVVKADLQGEVFEPIGLDPASAQGDRRLPELLSTGSTTLDLSDLPDQAMNVAVWCAFHEKATRLTGLSTLRGKESDRIRATVAMLTAVGVPARSEGDDLVIEGGHPLRFGRIETEGDHRLAIAGTLLGLLGEGVELSDSNCVSKSDPNFFGTVQAIRSSQRPILLGGLRGAGKTTTGRALAGAIGWGFVDTDEAFEAEHGPIPEFVESHGWPEFRRLEAKITENCLRPCTVVALGGGVVEGPFFDRLRTAEVPSVVVFLEEHLDTLAERIRGSDRPSLTGRPITEELSELEQRRRPRFESIAQIVCQAGQSVEARVEQIRSRLTPRRVLR